MIHSRKQGPSMSHWLSFLFRPLKRSSSKPIGVTVLAPVDIGSIDTLRDRVTLQGVSVQVNTKTQIENNSDSALSLSVEDITESDFYQISGSISNDNPTLIASRIERNNYACEIEINSIVANVDAVEQTLEILGILVTTSASTRFKDAQGSRLQASDFFAAITADLSIVNARWSPHSDISIAARELVLEDEFSNNLLGAASKG
jgi:hypothetical protein